MMIKKRQQKNPIYYQCKSTTLEIYDLIGKQVCSKQIPKEQKGFEMDVSGWNPGMYYFKLICHNQLVAGEKVIIH